jgi:hypothetical protein
MRKCWEEVESEMGVAGRVLEMKEWESIFTTREHAVKLYISYQDGAFSLIRANHLSTTTD